MSSSIENVLEQKPLLKAWKMESITRNSPWTKNPTPIQRHVYRTIFPSS